MEKDLEREVAIGISTSSLGFFAEQLAMQLPSPIDAVEKKDGGKAYQDMLDTDPVIASSIRVLKRTVLNKGIEVKPAIERPADPDAEDDSGFTEADYKYADEIAAFVREDIDNLGTPIEEVVDEMLDCLVFGHRVGELLYELRDGKLRLVDIKARPRENYAFVVDSHMRLLAVIVRRDARTLGTVGTQPVDMNSPDVMPVEKFLIFTWEPKNGDPRGTSVLRPCRNLWVIKQNIWPAYIKYLSIYGTPSLIAVLPEQVQEADVTDASEFDKADVDYDDDGAKVSPAASLLQNLLKFQNGSALVVEHGTEVTPLEVKTNGDAFEKAVKMLDRQMVQAILGSTRATMESEHGSRADSKTSHEILEVCADSVRSFVERRLEQLARNMVKNNFPDAERLVPRLVLSSSNKNNLRDNGEVIAKLESAGYFHDSQKPELDTFLGVPVRDVAAIKEEKEMELEREQEMANEMNRLGMRERPPKDA